MARPTAFKPEYCEQAKKLCLLGAKDAELANFFGVSETTINNWKDQFPDFLESLKEGKEGADAKVAKSLFHRAIGFKHEAVKVFGDAKTGAEHVVPYTEHYPPDTTACIFWLKNRRPDLWRDQIRQEITGADGGPVVTQSLSPEAEQQLQALVSMAQAKVKGE